MFLSELGWRSVDFYQDRLEKLKSISPHSNYASVDPTFIPKAPQKWSQHVSVAPKSVSLFSFRQTDSSDHMSTSSQTGFLSSQLSSASSCDDSDSSLDSEECCNERHWKLHKLLEENAIWFCSAECMSPPFSKHSNYTNSLNWSLTPLGLTVADAASRINWSQLNYCGCSSFLLRGANLC